MRRIWLSPPDMSEEERVLLLDAFDSGWVAPVGEHLDRFEAEMSEYLGGSATVALSSGTAALHLALLLAGVGPGDEVIVPTLTFAAAANAVCYTGARPVFVDAEPIAWNLDPALLAEELDERASAGRLPAAVVAVDLYGQCADWDPILVACARHGIPVIEDAAEALGATCGDRKAGTLAPIGTLSFNGNKVMTTGGGGMLVASDPEVAERARYLSTQAREPTEHYEHLEVGYNYRLSNVLAAIGRGQLRRLPAMIARRRAVNARYRAALSDLPGIGFLGDPPWGTPTSWLTVLTVDEAEFGAPRNAICRHLETLEIEARPAWKPMHLQRAFERFPVRGGAVAERAFRTGVCLPSGSSMTDDDVDRVTTAVRAMHRAA